MVVSSCVIESTTYPLLLTQHLNLLHHLDLALSMGLLLFPPPLLGVVTTKGVEGFTGLADLGGLVLQLLQIG